jgi:diadenosine tetraphosphate (Ap4A) HIT family hydrolase
MTTTPSSVLPPSQWELHPQLAADTVPAGDLRLARLLVNRDANYPWLVLVPRRVGAMEIIDLDAADQRQLFDEITRTARVLKSATGCDKLNIAAIGNVVSQLHVHVVARYRTDAAWPRPVWGAVPVRVYEPAALERFVAEVRRGLGL